MNISIFDYEQRKLDLIRQKETAESEEGIEALSFLIEEINKKIADILINNNFSLGYD